MLGVLLLCASVVSTVAQDLHDLAQKIRHGDTEEKRHALYQIRNIQTAEASRIAVPAVQDKDEIVRATATQSIVFLPPDEALRVLLPLLKDKSGFVRKETAHALGKIQNFNAVQSLIAALQNDKDSEVKTVSTAALGEIGDVSALDPLLKILQSKPTEEAAFVRRTAARSIGQIAQIHQIKAKYVVTPESFLAQQYDIFTNLKYSNLAESFPGFRRSVGVLLAILQSPNESDDTRREAAFALGTIGDARAVEVLRANLKAKDYYLAEICQESLQKLSK